MMFCEDEHIQPAMLILNFNIPNNLGWNKIGDEAIIFLHQFPALQGLNLYYTKITGKGIKTLSEGDFPHLR